MCVWRSSTFSYLLGSAWAWEKRTPNGGILRLSLEHLLVHQICTCVHSSYFSFFPAFSLSTHLRSLFILPMYLPNVCIFVLCLFCLAFLVSLLLFVVNVSLKAAPVFVFLCAVAGCSHVVRINLPLFFFVFFFSLKQHTLHTNTIWEMEDR